MFQWAAGANGNVTVRRNVAADFRLLTLVPQQNPNGNAPDVTLNRVTFDNGSTTVNDPNGGAIYVKGKLTLNDSVVQNSTAVGNGGGIYVDGATSELKLNNTKVRNNQANADGGGITIRFGKAEVLAKSEVTSNTAHNRGGGISLVGFGGNNGVRLKIDDASVSSNTATNDGGGIDSNWQGVAAGQNVVTISKTTINNNRAVNGTAGGYFNGANTSADAQSTISFNKSGQKKGEAVVVKQNTRFTGAQVKMEGNQYLPPPGGGGGSGLSDSGFPDDGLPSAVYVELGGELWLTGCEIMDNEGHGVVGFVTSFGYNTVHNSLTSSAGWIGSDIVT